MDDAPLLSIIEDFLPHLDAFFVQQEELLCKCVDSCCQGQPLELYDKNIRAHCTALWERLSQAKPADFAVDTSLRVNDVNEKYVEALEMCCLLKQRLVDVRHNWRIVVQKALCDHDSFKREDVDCSKEKLNFPLIAIPLLSFFFSIPQFH